MLLGLFSQGEDLLPLSERYLRWLEHLRRVFPLSRYAGDDFDLVEMFKVTIKANRP
jgi:hypothetical protein